MAATVESSGVRWPDLAGAALVLLAVLALYGPLIPQTRLLERDDQRLVEPLRKLAGPGDYVDAVRAGRILDVQPVRDLSYWLELRFEAATGLTPFHATNVLLWLLAVALVQRLLAVRHQGFTLWLLVLLFALHPVFVGSVAWVAARKHLLSAVFTLGATVLVVRAKHWSAGKSAATAALYSLAVASQPITLLWPLWGAAELWRRGPTERRSAVQLFLACVPSLLLAAAVNFLYYRGAYVQQVGVEKFVDAEGTGGVALLSVGRAFANLVFPVALATQYSPGSVLNLVGLAALVLVAAVSLKFRPRGDVLSALGFFAFPLLVVTVRMTSIFLSDPYLLVPSVGVAWLLALWLPGERKVRAPQVALALVPLAFAVASHALVPTWSSESALWAHAAEVEPTPNALAKHAYYLAQQGRAHEALEVATRLGAWEPSHPEYPLVLARAVFLDSTLDVERKLELLHASGLRGGWPAYFTGLLELQRGHRVEAGAALDEALADATPFKAEVATVAAEAHLLCLQDGRVDCAERTAAVRAKAGPAWNEARFQARLAQQPR
ncbi:MAG: hypothetical protein K1X89_08280 [Myxococcaceae bacterium]|nr:hypothetical protein [Myxococcaceae bacterium]